MTLQMHEEEVTKLLFSKEVGGNRVQVGEGGGKVFVLWGVRVHQCRRQTTQL